MKSEESFSVDYSNIRVDSSINEICVSEIFCKIDGDLEEQNSSLNNMIPI